MASAIQHNDTDLRVPAPGTMLETPTSSSTIMTLLQGLDLSKHIQSLRILAQPDRPVLEKFTVFPDLPQELRRIIWTYSLPGPRVIEIFSGDNDKGLRISNRAHGALFAVMQICKESEEVVLSKYSKIKAEDWNLTGLPRPSTSILLFNYEHDMVHLSSATIPANFLELASKLPLDKVTSIGMDEGYFIREVLKCLRVTYSPLFHTDLVGFQGLRRIVIFRAQLPNNGWFFPLPNLHKVVQGSNSLMKRFIEGDRRLEYLGDLEIEAGEYGYGECSLDGKAVRWDIRLRLFVHFKGYGACRAAMRFLVVYTVVYCIARTFCTYFQL